MIFEPLNSSKHSATVPPRVDPPGRPKERNAPLSRPLTLPIFPALFAAVFLSTLVMRVTDPLVPVLSKEFGVSHGDIALFATAYAIPYGCFQLVFGPLGDRFGKTLIMRIALILLGLTILGATVATSYRLMLVSRALSGMVAGGIIPLGLASIGDLVPYERRQAVLSRLLLASILGQISGAFITGLLAEFMPWRTILTLYGGLAFLVAGVLTLAPGIRPVPGAAASFGDVLALYGSILAKRSTQVLLGIVFVEGALFFGFFGQVSPYLAEVRDASTGQIGAIVACIGLGGAVYSALFRPVFRLFGPYGMMRAGGVLGAIGVGLAALPWPLALYGATTALSGYAFYSIHIGLQTRATELAPEARGASLSLFAATLFMGNGFGPWMLGSGIEHFGYGTVFTAVGGLMLGLGLVAAAVFRRVEARV